jgi:hypothetical protein
MVPLNGAALNNARHNARLGPQTGAEHEREGRCHEAEEEEDRRESCRTCGCSGGWPYESCQALRGLECGRPSLDTVGKCDSPTTRPSAVAGFRCSDRAVCRRGRRSGLRGETLRTGFEKLGREKTLGARLRDAGNASPRLGLAPGRATYELPPVKDFSDPCEPFDVAA